MRKKLLLFILTFSILAFNTKDESIVRWSSKKLKISDFVPVTDPLPYGATAITSTGLLMQIDDTRACGWRAYGIFNKPGSKWYVNSNKRYDDMILEHEQ